MTSEGKIASAIGGLGFVLFFGLVLYPELKEWRAQRALAEYVEGSSSLLDQVSIEGRRAQQQERERQNRGRQIAAAIEDAKRLGAIEQCIGGAVVKVTEKDGVPTYVQVLVGGRPVKCEGRRRL